jgi:hypothetical protein
MYLLAFHQDGICCYTVFGVTICLYNTHFYRHNSALLDGPLGYRQSVTQLEEWIASDVGFRLPPFTSLAKYQLEISQTATFNNWSH